MTVVAKNEIADAALAATAEIAKKRLDAAHRLAIGIIVLTIVAMACVIGLVLSGRSEGVTQLVSVTVPTIASLLAYRKSMDNSAAVHQLHIAVDGRLTQLLEARGEASRAEGVAAERSERRIRDEDNPQNRG